MPEHLRPRVNEAHEFLEIAKDFKDAKEIIREALSNSWDANARHFFIYFDLLPIPGSRAKKIRVRIADDGEGMSSEPRSDVGSSEIEGFFNLGDSGKVAGSIGTKGHGTKIYYKSRGVTVDTWKNGRHLRASTDVDPWDSLESGIVPTYSYVETDDKAGRGTQIVVDGFRAKQSDFSDLEDLLRYIGWYTVAGSFGNVFGQQRQMDVTVRPLGSPSTVTVPFGFRFPDENLDLDGGTDAICKYLGPDEIDAGVTADGRPIKVQVCGAILGEDHRGIVPQTYTHMGLWLAKDFIRVERDNKLLEEVSGGQYYYRNFLLMANCQAFDLTANRNNIRRTDEYDMAASAIKEWCQAVWESPFTRKYWERKGDEDEERTRQERQQRALNRRNERVNAYRGRSRLRAAGVAGAPCKEPRSEAETALLLQAMISSGHPGIDFTIGDYNATTGVDMLVERTDRGLPGLWWVELVATLDKLAQWSHPVEGFNAVVCYALGNMPERQTLSDGRIVRLVKKDFPGRYALLAGSDTLEVYVLREILEGTLPHGTP